MNASSPFYLPTTQPLGALYMSGDGRAEAAEELDFPEPLAQPFQPREPEYMSESDIRMEGSDEPGFPEPPVQPFQPPKVTYMAETDDRTEGSDERRLEVAQPDHENDEPESKQILLSNSLCQNTYLALNGQPQTLSPGDGRLRARPTSPVAVAPRRDDKKKGFLSRCIIC